MCDHCVKRSKAYDGLSAEEQSAADAFSAQSEPQLAMLMIMGSQDDFENAYVEFGDTLDTLLGIGSSPATDFVPPDWSAEPPDWASDPDA
jgi:hypothetical protein